MSKGKQGHSFLFCLCDMRRAVIMLDVLSILGGLLMILAEILVYKYGDKDDEELQILLNNYSLWAVVVIQAVGVFCHILGVIGARRFSICLLLLPLLWNIVYAVLCGIDKNWVGLGFAIVWVYPHAFLCRELAQGIMTKENYYESERQSCCCV